MKTARLILVTAIAAGLVAFTSHAFAGGKGNGNGNNRGNGNGNKHNGGQRISGGSHKVHVGSSKSYWWRQHHSYVRYCPPVVIGVPLTVVPAGTVMEVPGYFGLRPGRVILDMSGKIIPMKVLNWSPAGVVVEVPFMPLPAPVCGKLVVIGWNDSPYRPLELKVVPSLGKPAGPVAGPVGGPGGPASGPALGAASAGPVAQVARP